MPKQRAFRRIQISLRFPCTTLAWDAKLDRVTRKERPRGSWRCWSTRQRLPRSTEWQGRDRVGDVVDQDDLIFVDDFLRYDLRPLPYGQRYAVVGGQIVVLDRESYQILQLMRAFTALEN